MPQMDEVTEGPGVSRRPPRAGKWHRKRVKTQPPVLSPVPLDLNQKVLVVKEALLMSPGRGGSCGPVEKGRGALFTLPGQPSSGQNHLVGKIVPGRGWIGGERNQA